MTELSTALETILKTAADREDGAIHPLPKTIKGGAAKKVIKSLKAKGLAEHGGLPDGNEDLPLLITNAGRVAIGLDSLNQTPAEDSFEEDVATAEQVLGITPTANDPEPETDAEEEPPTESETDVEEEPPTEPETNTEEELPTEPETDTEEPPPIEPKEEPTATIAEDPTTPEKQKMPKEPRPGTKKALVWEMLRRDEGATSQQIMEKTNWASHTVRGVIALAKKAGWNITTNRLRAVRPDRTGAKGSCIIYYLSRLA